MYRTRALQYRPACPSSSSPTAPARSTPPKTASKASDAPLSSAPAASKSTSTARSTAPPRAAAPAALPDGLPIALEIKHAPATAAGIAAVRRRGLEGRALIWSPHAAAVRYAARAAPRIQSSLLRDARSPAGVRRFLDDTARDGPRGGAL